MQPTMKRGVKIRLYPTKRQAHILDDWRVLTVRTWNLLLELQIAAYSGENKRPELRWRSIWEEIITELYLGDKKLWDSGRSAAGKRKEILPGKVQLANYEAELAKWNEQEEAFTKWKQEGRKGKAPERPIKKPIKPQEPKAPEAADLDKIHGRNYPSPTIEQELGLYKAATDATLAKKLREFMRRREIAFPPPGLQEKAARKAEEAKAAIKRHKENPQNYERHQGPGVFIWGKGKGRELLALLARLKLVPQTSWLGELPSHASQRICTELLTALARLQIGAGFPRFKTSLRDCGSIYFANTQLTNLQIGPDESFVGLPKGLGRVRCEPHDARLFREITEVVAHYARRHSPERASRNGIKAARKKFQDRVKGGKLLGGRVYRQGDKWWLAIQYDLPKPAPLEHPKDKVGVKVAAATLITTVDDQGGESQVPPLEIGEKQKKRVRFLALKQSRQEMAAREKAEKEQRRRDARAEKKEEEHAGKIRRPPPKRRAAPSKNYTNTLARIRREQHIIAEKRKRYAHEQTTAIAREYDRVFVRTMGTAELMKKQRRKRVKRPEINRRARATSSVRKIMANAAMAMTTEMLRYKVLDSGGVFGEIPKEFKDVQTCARCGTVNKRMKGRPIHKCDHCGHMSAKDSNAAQNAQRGEFCPDCGAFNTPMRDGLPTTSCAGCGCELKLFKGAAETTAD